MNILTSGRQVISLMAVCFFLSSSPLLAATPDRPDAGRTLGGLQDRKPPVTDRSPVIEIDGQPQPPSAVADGAKVALRGLRITGQNLYGEDKLIALVADAVDRELTFGDLEALAARIARHFRDHGYLLANAYIPAQEIVDGVVEIRVVVGQYGKIVVNNRSHLADSRINGVLGSLKSGGYIERQPLERALLLLSDTSGVSARASLAPGAVHGTSDLTVEINDAKPLSGEFFVNNHVNRFTGRTKAGLILNINNPSGLGDTATIGGIYTGSGLNNYTLDYRRPIGDQGAKWGVGFSRLHYSLGEEFAALDATGLAKTVGVYVTYPLIRSREHNLTGRLGYDRKHLQDRIDSTPADSRKKAGVWSLAFSGDSRDPLGGGGFTSFALGFTSGRLTMDSADAEINDLLPQSAGNYSKTNISIHREQYITDRLNFHLYFTGQLANKNLDSAEKLSAGGANGVRAYPEGEAAGDQGYIFNGELCWNLPTTSFQMAFFYDNAKIIPNKNPWDASTNKRVLAGAGFGLIWNRAGDYAIRLDYAWKITADPATADTDKNGRLWLVGAKYF